MDVLHSVLSSMKLSGGVFLEASFTEPWCVTSKIGPEDCSAYFLQPAHVIAYHYVVAGEAYCAIGSEPPTRVVAGQILLLPKNEQHVLGSRLDGAPADARALIEPADGSGLPRIVWGGGGAPTTLLCGFLGTLTPISPFLTSLPSILVVDASAGAAGEWLASSIRYALQERSPEVIGKLAELLFFEAVKRYVASLDAEPTGWLTGLRDPHLSRALALIHECCADAWTTDALAREAGLSRSAFAERFTRLLGDPPMRYLARHRMNVAASLLQEGRQNASNVAYSVGFNSEAAFNRAFKKEFGIPPGAWQREKIA
ncbi:MAG: AraC family transcriptional regulator [Alphaproteobacteria bacterium]|nr:AraC family transcriptional regulator [Alphaproteobacteria bacterium]